MNLVLLISHGFPSNVWIYSSARWFQPITSGGPLGASSNNTWGLPGSWGYPKIVALEWNIPSKWMLSGYPHFRKYPHETLKPPSGHRTHPTPAPTIIHPQPQSGRHKDPRACPPAESQRFRSAGSRSPIWRWKTSPFTFDYCHPVPYQRLY